MVSEGVGARIHRQPCIADGDSGYVGICEVGPARKMGAVFRTALYGQDGDGLA